MLCLGNEMDGPWQPGTRPADEYGGSPPNGRALHQSSQALELVACGSSGRRMPTFASWEAAVLEHAYDEVDFISAPCLLRERQGSGQLPRFTVGMDNFINDVITAADYVRARKNKTKRINISVDEWNVWYLERGQPRSRTGMASGAKNQRAGLHSRRRSRGGVDVITLLRHSDRVTSACIAQLVNTIAPIRSEPNGPSWRQTTFFPFALTQQHARGDVLRVEPQCPTYTTDLHGDVPVVDAVATRDPDDGAVSIFVREPASQGDPAPTTGGGRARRCQASSKRWPWPTPPTSRQLPTAHGPRRAEGKIETSLTEDGLDIDLPAVSWSCIRLATGVAGAPDIVS